MSIQLENMVPEYYVNKSRDFQLLCSTMDIFLGATEEKSKKILNNWSIETLDESLLPLMARKLGLSISDYIPPKILRNLCKIYPKALKYKGTLQAIRDLAYAVFSAYQEVYQLTVTPTDADKNCILISSDAVSGDEQYLDLVLPNIVPAGVTWQYSLGLTVKRPVITTPVASCEIYRLRGVGGTISRVMRGVPAESPDDVDISNANWSTSLSNKESTDSPPHPYSRVGFAQITNSIKNVGSVYIDKTIKNNTNQ